MLVPWGLGDGYQGFHHVVPDDDVTRVSRDCRMTKEVASISVLKKQSNIV